jgi:hypothetical protein
LTEPKAPLDHSIESDGQDLPGGEWRTGQRATGRTGWAGTVSGG